MRRELTRKDVLSLLREVGAILEASGVQAAIYVVGGAAMSLEYSSRRITMDVDAQAREERDEFWKAARLVAERTASIPTG